VPRTPVPAAAARLRRWLCIATAAVAMIVAMNSRAAGPPDDADGRAAGRPDRPAGGATPAGDPGPATLADALASTRAVSSARVELTTTVEGPSGPVVLAHRAAFVDGGLRATAESDMSQVAEALGAAGQRLEGDWSQPARVVVEAGTVYSQLGPMAESLGRSPDEWTRAELADLVGSPAVADNDALALALDPLGPLDLLRRPVVEIGEVPGGAGRPGGAAGGSGVRGVATRHFRASLDLVGGTEGGPPEGSFEARLAAAGVDALPVDVWLDGDGVVRRMVVAIEAAGEMTTTFEVFDVGEVGEGDVAAPSPDDVLDAGELRVQPPPGNGNGDGTGR
jgi:hypothetical protein